MDVFLMIVAFGPLLAPLGAYITGCLVWRGSFARRRWPPVAWYYGSLLAVLAIAASAAGIGNRFQLDHTGLVIVLYLGLVFWALGFLLGLALLVIERSRNKAITQFCRGCAYDLTGNVSDVCPECGAVISREQRDVLDQRVPDRGG